MPDEVVNLFAVFICIYYYMHLLLFSNVKFPEPLISTTISRCPGNFINLGAIIVAFWPSEYDSKLRRNFQITISKVTLGIFKKLSKN